MPSPNFYSSFRTQAMTAFNILRIAQKYIYLYKKIYTYNKIHIYFHINNTLINYYYLTTYISCVPHIHIIISTQFKIIRNYITSSRKHRYVKMDYFAKRLYINYYLPSLTL